MNILIIDDEQMALHDLRDTVTNIEPTASIDAFDNCSKALEAAKVTNYDIAFLDITMPGKNGIELSKDLKDIYPNTNIIFVTGYSDYAVTAFSLNASGYILKPAGEDAVRNAMDNLRIPAVHTEKGLRVQCFGNFEVFYGKEKVKFKRNLTKELFAYLVNLNGASANTNELCSVLFQEDTSSNKHYLRNLIADLKTTLKLYNAEEVFIYKRNSFSVDVSKLNCDYYDFLNYDISAINRYYGYYMKQYDWAEMTNGFLNTTVTSKSH